jgi:hypothetical protein
MKPSDLRDLLVKLLPAREPVLLVGPPGVGKSDIADQVAAKLDYDLILSHPVVSDPTDFKGMPAVVADEAGPRAEFLPFGDLSLLLEAARPTVVMMDDVGQAPPAVQAALMQLLLARRINGHAISDEVRFLAATNRRQDKAAVTGLIAPLLDRFTVVLPVEFDVDDWVAWGIDNGMPPELLAFARLRPQLMSEFEASRDMTKSPTPRSVAGLGRLVTRGILDFEVLAGAAGQGFATEFLAFHRTWSALPDRVEIYMNPDSAPVPEAPDVLYALMGSLAYAASAGNWDQTVRYLERVPPEYSVFCVRDAIRRNRALVQTRAFTQWALAHAEVFSYDAAA